MSEQFPAFCSDLLIALEEGAQKNPNEYINLNDLACALDLQIGTGWVQAAAEAMVEQGLIRAEVSKDDKEPEGVVVDAQITGAGRIRVAAMRREAQEQKVVENETAGLGSYGVPNAASMQFESEMLADSQDGEANLGLKLFIDPEGRIQISNDDIVPASHLNERLESSREHLILLQKQLDSLHGFDEEVDHGENRQKVPLSDEQLGLLRATVSSAIALHDSPSFTRRHLAALKSLTDALGDWKEPLNMLADTVDSLKRLATELGMAYLAIKELCDIIHNNLP